MRAPEANGAPVFWGSISRRFTLLSVLFLLLVALVGGLSVQRARRMVRLHTEIEELGTHSEALDRLENAIFHLRAETQDALFLGQAFDDPSLRELPRQVQEQWKRFEQMHSRDGQPWVAGTPRERALYEDLGQSLSRFIDITHSVVGEKRPGSSRLREAAFLLHMEAHRLEDGLRQMSALHRELMADRSRAARADMDIILWTYVVFIALLCLTVALASVLFVRRVGLPLQRLNAAALDVAGGNFSRRVPVLSRDEIGMLTHTFNRMAEALSGRDTQVRRRAQEMEALYRIGTDISSFLKIDRIITSVVESARALFAADAAGLALADGASGEIRWTVFEGEREGAFREMRLRPGQGVAGRVMATGDPQIVEDAREDLAKDPEAHPILAAEELRAALAVPLRRGERTLGALMVAYHAPRRFAADEVLLLSSFANQVAVVVENAELYEQVHMLHRVGIQISSMLNLDRILQTVVESGRAMLRTDVAALWLLRDGGPHLDIAAAAGPWEGVMGPDAPACAGATAAGSREGDLGGPEVRPGRDGGQLSARLKLGDQVLGVLCVGSATPRIFGEAERELMGGLAAQAAIAIGNARLYERARGLATLEERERLAREMHDGLAQALGFLSLKLALAEGMAEGVSAEPMRKALAEMRKVTSVAYEEIRQAIFGLRTMVSRGLGLVPTLSEYLHEFSQQSGIQVHLQVSEEAGHIRFAPEVEVQLIRIVQEALNNVRKHSSTRTARVRLWQETDDVLVAVEDDGVGFDPAGAPVDGRRHYGLSSMRERAESVGGTLAVQSEAGKGTQVILRVRPNAGQRGGLG